MTRLRAREVTTGLGTGRLVVAGVLVAGLLAGCTGGDDPEPPPIEAPSATPTPVATATEQPTPSPSPEEVATQPPPPPATPFTVSLDDVVLSSTSNEGMFARPDTPLDQGAALAAVEQARLELETYLNAMLVAPATRFSTGAVGVLVDPTVLTPEALAGLGVLDGATLPGGPAAIAGTVTGTATAAADVQVDGGQVGVVTLTYTASTDLVVGGVRGPVVQQGTLSLADRGAGPDVILLTASTTFGGELPQVIS